MEVIAIFVTLAATSMHVKGTVYNYKNNSIVAIMLLQTSETRVL